jgi:hypothetical protein
MISPVTSTSVATNGADAVAGSNPIFFSMRGIIDPEKVPHKDNEYERNRYTQSNPYPIFTIVV